MGGKSITAANKKSASSELGPFLFLFLILFAFWLVLSGKYEVKYVTIGFFTALIIAIITRPLLMLPSEPGKDNSLCYLYDLPWFRLMAYFPWLMWQIVVANLQVTSIILNPRLPIQPQLVSFRKKLPGPVAYLTLANSITLTPGTITVELEGNRYLVHAIGNEAAQSLVPEHGEGDMPYRVGVVFGEREKEYSRSKSRG